jgi:hypothetical protein
VSLQPALAPPVPELTARVARAAFPKGNPYLRLRDELGPVFRDADFAGLYPRRGQPALPPWKLALVTILQFAEDLSDRQAADAVRGRIDSDVSAHPSRNVARGRRRPPGDLEAGSGASHRRVRPCPQKADC